MNPTITPSPTPNYSICTPTLTVTEVFPGSLSGFTSITAGANSVTVDVDDNAAGLQGLTLINSTNANVAIPSFPAGTLAPVTSTFTIPNVGQPVDFTMRASARRNAILIRAQCAGAPTPTPSPTPMTCTPTLTITEVFPDSLPGFSSIVPGPGTVTVDPVDSGIGLQAFTVVSASNANVTIPNFQFGTFAPVTATFTIPTPSQPVDFTLRASSRVRAVLVRGRCGG